MSRRRRVIVLDTVGLSPDHLTLPETAANITSLASGGYYRAMRPVFPAVTLPVQASLTTGEYPRSHGIVANGTFFADNCQVAFWEQASKLVQSPRIWDALKQEDPGFKTATLFLQNTLYAECEAIITPKPIHTDSGLVQWCYSKPPGLYESVSERLGEFNLMHYWGPMASIESSRWIAGAALDTLDRLKPDLMFVYLPHLDYCSQRLGPTHRGVLEELKKIDAEIGRIVKGVADLALEGDTVFVLLSEYTFSEVSRDIPINRKLRENGLIEVRTIGGREYLDLELSPAFAMVDHQVAHIYVKPGYEEQTRKAVGSIEGIDHLLDSEGKREHHIDHPRSGDLVAVSARDRWFSYYWWDDPAREPDFAGRIDIHRKPGYDPLELFIEDPKMFRISQDTSLIRGSHGYPPIEQRDLVPLVIGGDLPKGLRVPEQPCITDVAGLIRDLLASA